ncbi:MFS transporter [Ktedonospora formicarum]|uniref:MFS transporter n=1 Tax=Ktedonospora formicarum TaxID=2778364 RepID=A0A8J3MU16_9CHLR|nr:MFS transporter [Ktedonospora formicarum]GHO46168.1 MFS transporter [Ktedonospora formicarum]
MSTFMKAPCDEGVMRAAPQTGTCTRNVGIWVLVATILGSSMAFIDGSVINVALPVIQKELNATATDVQWIVEAYSLFLSALILVGGSLGDRFGRRRVFAIGVTIFILASLWCGFAPNVLQLILARAIQGIGAALLVPGSLAIISASFSDEQRGRAIGTWSGFTAITSVVGPVLGGVFVQYTSWRWVFFVNIPLAVIVLIVLFWRVPESRDESASKKLDWWGTLLVVVGLGALVYGLIEAGGTSLGNPVVLASLTIGVLALCGFLLVEARSTSPMVPLNLFRSPTLSGTNILTFLLYGALGAFSFFLPFNLIQVQGYPPVFASLAMVPFILLLFLFSRWAGGLVNRYGAKLPLIVGPTIVALGFVLFSIQGITAGVGSFWYTFLPAVILLGVGMTITVAPLTTAVMGSVEARHSGIASGINNAVSRTAGLLAIAVLGIVALSIFNSSLDSHLASLHLTPTVQQAIDSQRVKLAGITIPDNVSAGTQAALKQAIDESFVSSFRLIMLVCAGLALVSAFSAWLLVEGKRPTEPGSVANEEVGAETEKAL